MPNTPKQFLRLLITGLIAFGVLGALLLFRGGEDKKLLNETQTFKNSSSGVNVSFLAADVSTSLYQDIQYEDVFVR